MRADRMIATLLLMQSRGRITAAELAGELEVSLATARRDLEALSLAGVPVYPQPGRGGGWSLIGGARTDLTGLTSKEAEALFTLLGSAGSGSGSPEAGSAIRKLLRALPGPFRDSATAAAESVHVDTAGWGEEAGRRPDGVDAVRRAIIDRVRIRFDYTRRDGRGRTITVSPLGLIAKDDLWYLIAAPDDADSARTYRLDRVGGITVLDEQARRPQEFDLAQEWQRVVEYVEGRRSKVTATVRLPRRHLWVLRDHFGRYLQVLEETGDEVTVSVAAHTERSIAEQLAGWGSTISVLEPDGVRRELASIGAELVERYGGAQA